MTSEASVHDPRKHPICAPFYGESGPQYTRTFRTNFISNLWSEVDEGGWSLAEHLLKTDEGSPGNPIVGAAAYQTKARRLYNTRSKKVFTAMRKHIEHSSFRAAMNNPAVVGNGLAALALADEWFSGGANNLKLEKQNLEWQNVSLAQFGIHRNTIRMCEQHLQVLNGERPTGYIYNDNQLGARLLATFTFPDTLQADAMKEMHTPTLLVPAGTPGVDSSGTLRAGQYDVARIVTVYEAYFNAQIEAGRVKTVDAPKQSKPHSSNRVDGLSLEIAPKHAPEIEMTLYECQEVDDDGAEIFEIEFSDGQGTTEMICWNCGGLGHAQRDKSKPAGQDWVCPSPKKRRDPKTHIAALTKLAASRGGGTRPRVKFSRRTPGGPGPKNRFATRPSPKANQAELGGEHSDEHDTDNELSSVEPAQSKLICDSGATLTASASSPAVSTLEMHEDFDADFKKAFGISLDLAEVGAEAEGVAETNASVSNGACNFLLATLLNDFCAVLPTMFYFLVELTMLAAGNLARGPGRAVRFLGPGFLFALTIFALVTACSGSSIAATDGEHHISINELGCANNNSFPQQHASPIVKVAIPRDKGANTDSGATVTASDRRSLFPTSAVTEYNPKLSVTVANGIVLPVALKGAMVIKGRSSPYSSSAKKFVPVVILDAILVPGLRKDTVLLSPRNLFRLQGVKTYFNDELYLLLPNGTKIYLAETDTAYMIEIGEWDVTNLSAVAVNSISQWMQGNASDGWQPSSANGSTAAMVANVSPDRAHARCMHASYERLASSANFVTGLDLTSIARPAAVGNERDQVTPPLRAKPSKSIKYERFGQCVCSDAIKMPISTPFGYNGMVDFYDRATGYVAFYFLRTDTNLEMSTTFTLFELDHREWLPNGKVQLWFFDNHGQFVTGNSEEALAAVGTKVRSIVPWNPQQNPAERPWRSVLQQLRITMAANNVSEALWPFAASQWQFISNGLATRSSTTTQRGTSPFFMASGGKLANFSFLYELFCGMSCFVRSNADRNRYMSKLTTRVDAVHLGIHPSKPALLAYVIPWKRFTCFRVGDCIVHEDVRPQLDFITGSMLMPDSTEVDLPTESQQRAMGVRPRQPSPSPPVVAAPAPAPLPTAPPQMHVGPLPPAVDVDETELAIIYSLALQDNVTSPLSDDIEPFLVRDGQPVIGFSLNALNSTSGVTLPKNFAQADTFPDAKLWRLSGDEEYKAKFAVNNTGRLVSRKEAYDAGKKVIPTKVVFGYKYNDDNSIKARTTRYTACGNWQQPEDFSESYTATGRATGFRTFCCHVVNRRMHLLKGDVIKAFTQSTLDVDLYIEQMDGYVEGKFQPDGRPELVVYIEKGKGKAIEGLVQSGHIFQDNHNETLEAPIPQGCGLTICDTEPCISRRVVGNDTLSTYWHIDDSLIGTTSTELSDEFFKNYTKSFPMKPFEPVTDTIFAGVRITYDPDEGVMVLSQAHILERAADKFFGGKELIDHRSLPYTYDGKTRASSLDKLRLAESDEEIAAMKGKPLLSLLMTLLYVALYTAPHCLHAIVRQGRYMSNPAPYNWKELCNLFGYMYHHRHEGLTIRRSYLLPKVPSAQPSFPADDNTFFRNLGFHVMPDASWKVLRTYAGFAIFVMGVAVDYQSQLIRVICHSTAEAETAAACFAAKRAMYVLQLLRFLGHDIACPIGYLIDCSAVEELSKKRGATKRTEHFLRWFHHFRWIILHRYGVVHSITDPEMLADILTKCVNPAKFHLCAKGLRGSYP